MWKFITENAETIGVIIAASAAFGSLITFILGWLVARKDRKSGEISSLNSVIEKKDNEINNLKQQLEKFTIVEQSTEGNLFILKEKNMKICPVCWGKDKNPIAVYGNDKGKYECNVCGFKEIYDINKCKESQVRDRQFTESIWSLNLNNDEQFNINDYI